MNHRISRRARVLAGALGAGLLVPCVAAAAPAVAATPQVSCTSEQAGLAAKLQKDITAAIANRRGTIAVGLHNGWLSRATHGWRVHSIGTFKGGGRDYMISVLTHGNSTMNYGVTTIQGIAKAIHKDLVPVTSSASAQRYVPTSEPEEAFVPVPTSGELPDIHGESTSE